MSLRRPRLVLALAVLLLLTALLVRQTACGPAIEASRERARLATTR